jgi:hypothetical protein
MQIDMEPMNSPEPEKDHEGAMAKADLYKLANYSIKLFKQLESEQQLEGWVQAKITKAADYIASVYHYMEYEMKFSEYGQAIEDSDVYTEGQKRVLKNKLMEAKEKIKDLKKTQAEKLKKKEEKVDEASGFRASDKKKGKVEKSEKKQYFVKLEKEGKTKGVTMVADEGETQGDICDRAKRDNQGWSVASVRLKDSGSGEEVSEAKKNDGNLANNAKPYDKVTKGDVVAGRLGKDEMGGKKKDKKVAEASKPSAGMTAKEKSAVVKKAVAGKDIGKPGKGFEKVEKAAKASGAKDPKAVAGAAMWKQQAKK